MDPEKLKALAAAMQSDCDKCRCGCPVDNMLELDAAMFAARSSAVNGSAMEAFALNMAAHNSLLLQIQAKINGLPSN